MKLWLSRPKKGKKKHLVLDMTASEERESSTLIRKHILSRGVRPVRAQKGQRVRYRFNMKYLDRLILAFPMAEHSPGVDALMKKSTAALLEEEVPDLGEIPWFTGELWDFQKIAVKHIVENEDFMLNDEMGLGKMQPYDARILTPSGWRTMGELNAGTEITGSEGKPIKVTAVYEHGEQEVYRVTLSDGTSTECGLEHLWNVQHVHDRGRGKPFRTLSLEQIVSSGLKQANGNRKWFLPMVQPVHFDPVTLPIAPYVLGAWLGDGTTKLGTITVGDPELLRHIEAEGYTCGKNIASPARCSMHTIYNLKKHLAANGLLDNKHIPEIYKRGSVEQRISLLQGLLDTDGTISSNGDNISFSSTLEGLVLGVQELVESLGGSAIVRKTRKPWNYKDGRTHSEFLRCTIRLPSGIQPFRLSRKAVRYTVREKYLPARAIESVECVGRKKCRCIRVDAADRLYVTDHYIVTHNTYSAYAALCLLEAFPALVVCPNNAKWVWQRVGEEVTELDIQVVEGTPAQRAEQIEREADVTIINFEGLRAVKMPDPEDKRRKLVIPKSNPALFDYEYAMLITDEYHRVKNPGAQQTVGYLELEAERQLHMSGTPILNRPDEIWPTLHRIDPARFNSFYMFEKAIVMRDGGKIVGYEPRAMSDLRSYIAEKSLRRRKDQVINDLPHVVYSTRPVELTTEQRRLYNQIRDNFIIETEDQQQKRVHYRSQIMREKQACFSPELYGGSTTSAKIDELKVVVKELVDNGEKAIIFSQWAKATRIIERELADYNPAYVDGSVKGSKRMAQVDKFNEDEDCHLYIGTIGANKESITLDAATYVIFTDKDWNPKNNEQAAARSAAGGLRGVGVEGTVNIIELIARDTIEEKIEEMLAHKIAVFNSLIEADGGAEPVRITLEDYRNLFEESA